MGGGGVVSVIFYPIYFNTTFQVVFHKSERFEPIGCSLLIVGFTIEVD
jgi:hypothetical protein